MYIVSSYLVWHNLHCNCYFNYCMTGLSVFLFENMPVPSNQYRKFIESFVCRICQNIFRVCENSHAMFQ